MQALAQELALGDSVIFAGVRSNIQSFYDAMDAFMLPSLFEGLPVVLVEAQTAGLPCFVSDTVDPGAAFTDRVRFLPLQDTGAWADAIAAASFRRDPQAREKAVRAGYDMDIIPSDLATYGAEAKKLLQDLQKLFSEEYIRIELPEADRILQIDRTQIEQVLINLIKNAKEACSRKEHPRIEVKMLPALSWQCLITVSDNGEGILPEVQDKIFVPFFTTKPSGSGIGLSLCKQVMNRHGGNITVQSTVGKGSCFTLLFG